MKTIVLMLCLAFIGGTANTAFAQDNARQKQTPEESATKRTEKMTEALALNAEQQKQVYDLLLKKGQQKEEINNAKLTSDERRDAMKELHASFEKQLKTVLNADQYKKYQIHKEEMKHQRHGDHKGHQQNKK